MKRKPQRQTRAMLEPIAEAGTAPRWFRKPRRQERKPKYHRVPRVKLPIEQYEGKPVLGYKGSKIYKGGHVRRVGEDRPGLVTGAGPQQCVVKWYHIGAEQSEVTAYLEDWYA